MRQQYDPSLRANLPNRIPKHEQIYLLLYFKCYKFYMDILFWLKQSSCHSICCSTSYLIFRFHAITSQTQFKSNISLCRCGDCVSLVLPKPSCVFLLVRHVYFAFKNFLSRCEIIPPAPEKQFCSDGSIFKGFDMKTTQPPRHLVPFAFISRPFRFVFSYAIRSDVWSAIWWHGWARACMRRPPCRLCWGTTSSQIWKMCTMQPKKNCVSSAVKSFWEKRFRLKNDVTWFVFIVI